MDDKKDIKQLIDDLLINKYGIKNNDDYDVFSTERKYDYSIDYSNIMANNKIKNKSNKNKIKRRKARKYH